MAGLIISPFQGFLKNDKTFFYNHFSPLGFKNNKQK